MLTILLVIGYGLPWVSTPGTIGFTNSAYDLAEWVSIHPIVRGETLLLTSLLLRLPLLAIALFVAFSLRQSLSGQAKAVCVLLVAAALLPPLEFFTSATSDPNYQQMFLLAAASLILGCLGITLTFRRLATWATHVQTIVLVGGAGAGIAGLARSLSLMQSFAIDSGLGIGAVVFVACVVLTLWMTVGGVKAQPQTKRVTDGSP